MAEKLILTIPPGRYINGSITEKQKFAYDARQPNNRGAELPPDEQAFYFGVAVRKDQQGGSHGDITGTLNAIYQHAYAGYAADRSLGHILPRIQTGPMDPNAMFAWKISDGDAMDPQTGKLKNENAAGCWVFSFRTKIPFKCADVADGKPMTEVPASEITRGDYIDVNATVSINGQTDHTAGIYINPNNIRRVGRGQPIVSGPTLEQSFASSPVVVPTGALPPGTFPTPPAAAVPQVPGMAPQVPQMAPQVPQAPQMAPQVPGMAPQLPPGYPQQMAPQVPGAAPTVPPAGMPAMPALPTASPSSPPQLPPGVQPHYGLVPGHQPPAGMPTMPQLPPGYPQQ